MKYSILFICLMVSLTSFCQKQEDEEKKIKSVATKFLKAMSNSNYNEAKKYGTDATDDFLDMVKGFEAMTPDSVKQAIAAARVQSEQLIFHFTDLIISDDRCTLNFYVNVKPEDIEQMALAKIGNDWFVHMQEDPME